MAVQAQMYADNLGLPFCGSLDWNGGGGLSGNDFCFNLEELTHPQQPQHPQQMEQQQQQFLLSQQLQNPQEEDQFLAVENVNINISMAFSQGMATQIEKQRQEIDRYINLQNERLKWVLREQRKQEFAALLRRLDARTAIVMRQKDEEIALAGKRTMELEEFMKRMETENEEWKRVAGENELIISNINSTLEQLREKSAIFPQQQPSNGAVEDAESCCEEEEGRRTGESNGETGTEEERSRKRRKMMVCRNCHSGKASVLFLPCRHLCCCKACEAFLYLCPVCNSAKEGTIEALLS